MTKYFKDLFTRDHYRCVYCGRDMMTDFDTFMLTQEDHLIPRAKQGTDGLDNRVIACFVCNLLKGSYQPSFPLTAANRAKYIAAVRDYIMSRRAVRMADFISWTHPSPAVARGAAR